MAFGDVGGNGTELVITCRTRAMGSTVIAKGDPVILTGNYEVCAPRDHGHRVFGQAMANTDDYAQAGDVEQAIPVKVCGICVFKYVGKAPKVDGWEGVLTSQDRRAVKAPEAGSGWGLNLKVDTEKSEVHVLL